MGGFNSNRWGDYKRKVRVEECISIDVNDLLIVIDHSCLKSCSSCNINSPIGTGNSGYLTCEIRDTLGKVGEVIKIVYSERSFRWYWICPYCERHVTKLYIPKGKRRMKCRHCHNLTYRSIQERRKYQSLSRMLVKGTDIPPKQMEKFLQSDWGKK